MTVVCCVHLGAGAAHAPVGVLPRIRIGIFVSAQAMRLLGVERRNPHAPTGILARRDRLQVVRVHAEARGAPSILHVVDVKAIGDCSNKVLIRSSMHPHALAGNLNVAVAVAVGIRRSQPDPATPPGSGIALSMNLSQAQSETGSPGRSYRLLSRLYWQRGRLRCLRASHSKCPQRRLRRHSTHEYGARVATVVGRGANDRNNRARGSQSDSAPPPPVSSGTGVLGEGWEAARKACATSQAATASALNAPDTASTTAK